MSSLDQRIKNAIRDVPDFPKPGILFKDITPVLADAKLFGDIVGHYVDLYKNRGVDVVVGMESRGFLFGAPLAIELGAAFAPARKPGKLPYKSVAVEYTLEYGSNTLELHIDAIHKGNKVVIIDDLIATGGTAKATCELVEKLGGEVVGVDFVIELDFLGGRKLLGSRPVHSLVHF